MLVITVARKPLEGSVAANAIKYGCGGINIDGTRIATVEDFSNIQSRAAMKLNTSGKTHNPEAPSVLEAQKKLQNLGRWPANVILTPATATAVDAQSGIVPTGAWNRQKDTAHPFGNAKDTPYETWRQPPKEVPGGASRFFKVVGQSDPE